MSIRELDWLNKDGAYLKRSIQKNWDLLHKGFLHAIPIRIIKFAFSLSLCVCFPGMSPNHTWTNERFIFKVPKENQEILSELWGSQMSFKRLQMFVVNCLFLAVHLHWPNQMSFPWYLHTNPEESIAYMHKTVTHSNEHICGNGRKFVWSCVTWICIQCKTLGMLQIIRRECTKVSEWSTRWRTCWRRSAPDRPTGPDTV